MIHHIIGNKIEKVSNFPPVILYRMHIIYSNDEVTK